MENPPTKLPTPAEAARELDLLRRGGHTLQTEWTPVQVFYLVAHLQFALRHPRNTGASSQEVKQIALKLQAWLSLIAPRSTAVLEMGWHEEAQPEAAAAVQRELLEQG